MSTVASATYSFDSVHSSTQFEVKHMGVATFAARVKEFDASLAIDDSGAISITGTAKMASLDISDETFLGHLLSGDFFNVESTPYVTFASTSVRRDGDTLEVDGELTVRGVTKPVHATGTITGPYESPFGGEKIGITLETVVDRRDYGLDWQAQTPSGTLAAEWDVRLVAHLEFAVER